MLFEESDERNGETVSDSCVRKRFASSDFSSWFGGERDLDLGSKSFGRPDVDFPLDGLRRDDAVDDGQTESSSRLKRVLLRERLEQLILSTAKGKEVSRWSWKKEGRNERLTFKNSLEIPFPVSMTASSIGINEDPGRLGSSRRTI